MQLAALILLARLGPGGLTPEAPACDLGGVLRLRNSPGRVLQLLLLCNECIGDEASLLGHVQQSADTHVLLILDIRKPTTFA